MKMYPEYKDSEIDWIGEIPKHWYVKRIKHVTSKVGSGITPKGGAEVYQENGVPLLRSQNVYNYGFRLDDVAYISDEIHQNMSGSLVLQGDILLNITGGSIGRSYYVSDEFEEANVNQHVCILRPNEVVNTKFLHAFIISQYGQLQIQLCQVGGNREAVNFEQIKNFYIPWVNYEEQTNIANYLDHKTSEIDALIAKKKQLIELYKEERTATINQTVTKGLDPNVPMKDSGIDWIGEIPEHWVVKPLRYLGSCQNGISAGAEYFGSGFPFVSYSDVYNNEELPNLVSGLVQSSIEDQERYSVNEGDVFFTRTSETVEEIAFASTCLKTIENSTFAGFLIRFRPFHNLLHSHYSKYFFRSTIHRNFFIKEMNIVTRASLGQGLLKKLSVLLPPMDEQVAIANWLNDQLAQLDGLVLKTEKEISLLEEYKMALISEVVLGKVDVREEVLN